MSGCRATLPSPMQMVQYLDRYVRGQSAAKEVLASAVYNHYLSLAWAAECPEEANPFGKNHVLLIGPTGSGKSYLVRRIAEQLDVPVAFSSAAGLVEAGYVGEGQVDSLVRSLFLRADHDVKRAERGIVFLDEIDKIRRQPAGCRDVSGEGVQNALLTLLDGRPVTVKVAGDAYEIDTTNVLFICAGAFVDLPEIIRERLRGSAARNSSTASATSNAGETASPGANSTRLGLAGTSVDDLYEQALPADVQSFGFIPELVGRFSGIASVRSLAERDFIEILEGAEESPLVKEQRLFLAHGIELSLSPAALSAIAQQARNLGTGARALAPLVGRAVQKIRLKLPELARGDIARVVVTEGVVAGYEDPILEYRAAGTKPLPNPSHALRRRAFRMMTAKHPPADPASVGFEFTDPSGLSNNEIWEQIQFAKGQTGFARAGVGAKSWWTQFERDHRSRGQVVLRVAEELKRRKASIQEFYDAFVAADSVDIQAVLHYLDYARSKRTREARTADDHVLSKICLSVVPAARRRETGPGKRSKAKPSARDAVAAEAAPTSNPAVAGPSACTESGEPAVE